MTTSPAPCRKGRCGVIASCRGGLFLALLVLGLPRLVRQRDEQALGLVLGLGVSLAGFYLVAGVWAIRPSTERYAVFLLMPSCLVLAMLIRSLGDSPRAWTFQALGTAAVGGLLLGGFSQHYFGTLLETGGHHTGRSAPGRLNPSGRPLTSFALPRAVNR
jgi:hypothetical protein